MPTTCPICGQPVQKLDAEELQKRVEDLASPLVQQETKRIQEAFDQRVESEKRKLQAATEKRIKAEYQEKLVQERRAGLAEAEKIFSTKLSDAKRKASELEQKFNEKLTAARTELQHKLEKQSTTAVQQAVRDAEKRFERSEAEKEKDRLKFESEKTRLQDQLEKLSRKLEGQSGEELGEDGERDLVVLLRRAFQGDRIDRIGRGVKGAEARLLQLTAKA